ncbi:hypothetical protein J2X42_002620 [Arthrobacter sp. BE255]|nr:hypothetical protein [Arthrobacter sp. BE255]
MGVVDGAKEEMQADWTPAAAFWEIAESGDAVRLQKPGWPPHEGYVDDKTPDGDIVWVVRVGELRLFHRADGYSLIVCR